MALRLRAILLTNIRTCQTRLLLPYISTASWEANSSPKHHLHHTDLTIDRSFITMTELTHQATTSVSLDSSLVHSLFPPLCPYVWSSLTSSHSQLKNSWFRIPHMSKSRIMKLLMPTKADRSGPGGGRGAIWPSIFCTLMWTDPVKLLNKKWIK